MAVSRYRLSVFRIDEDSSDDEATERQLPRASDLFAPFIDVIYDFYRVTANSRYRVTREVISLTLPSLSCRTFLGIMGEPYLLEHLSNLPYFTDQQIRDIIPEITTQVRRAFGNVTYGHLSGSGTNLPPPIEFSFNVELHIEIARHFPDGMIPASEPEMFHLITNLSEEAVAAAMEAGIECTICMENLIKEDVHDDDDVACSLPCAHQFHRGCIVNWLRTSHVCPVCRYPMPTLL